MFQEILQSGSGGEKELKDLITPKLTSETASKAIKSNEYKTFYGWKAFDGIDDNDNAWIAGSNNRVNEYIGFIFDKNVAVRKAIISIPSMERLGQFRIEASNDSSFSNILYTSPTFVVTKLKATYLINEDSIEAKYWRVFAISAPDNIIINEIYFYG